MKNEDEEPKLWVTVIKLLVGFVILVGGTGLALWYVDKAQVLELPPLGTSAGEGLGSTGWGIVGDSPVKQKR
jgi:hypothetical protein